LKKQEKRIRMKKTIALSTVLALAALGMACGEPAPANNKAMNAAVNNAMNAANKAMEASNKAMEAANNLSNTAKEVGNKAMEAGNKAMEAAKESANTKPADNTKKP
jgi:hypothetical protein